jgi:hypothetical protein
VRGVLHAASASSITLLRDDPRVGSVAVHFPRAGFEISRAG